VPSVTIAHHIRLRDGAELVGLNPVFDRIQQRREQQHRAGITTQPNSVRRSA